MAKKYVVKNNNTIRAKMANKKTDPLVSVDRSFFICILVDSTIAGFESLIHNIPSTADGAAGYRTWILPGIDPLTAAVILHQEAEGIHLPTFINFSVGQTICKCHARILQSHLQSPLYVSL